MHFYDDPQRQFLMHRILKYHLNDFAVQRMIIYIKTKSELIFFIAA